MPILKDFEARLLENGGPFFSSATPGIGDLCLFAYMDLILTLIPEILDQAGPFMQAWFKTCAALPGIGAYLAARPQLGAGALGQPGSLMREGSSSASARW